MLQSRTNFYAFDIVLHVTNILIECKKNPSVSFSNINDIKTLANQQIYTLEMSFSDAFSIISNRSIVMHHQDF